MRKRHLSGVSLGGIDVGSASPEVDLSSMDSAIVYIAATLQSTVAIEAASEPFGEAATWRQLGDTTVTIGAGESLALPAARMKKGYNSIAPFAGSAICPRRLRIRCVSGNAVTSAWVEGVRTVV